MLAPALGLPSACSGLAWAPPSWTAFHSMVRGANQPPRNQAWFTFVSGSDTVAAKAASSQGLSFDPSPHRMNPPAMGRTACGLPPVAMKFFALKENTASKGLRLRLVNLYSRAATGRLELSASPGSNGLQPVISTFNGICGSVSATMPNGKRLLKVALAKRGRP